MRLAALAIIALLYAAPVSAQSIARQSLLEGAAVVSLDGVAATTVIPFEANGRPGKELLFLNLTNFPITAFVGAYRPGSTARYPASHVGDFCLEPSVQLQPVGDGFHNLSFDDMNGDGLDDIIVTSTNRMGQIEGARLTVGKGLQYCK